MTNPDKTKASGEAVNSSEDLLPVLYDELRRLASRRLASDWGCDSIQTTELVHEAYLRLVGGDQHWSGRGHFFAAAAEAMRRILIDRARQKKQKKRGGDYRRIPLEADLESNRPAVEEMLMVDEMLDRFCEQYPQEGELVKLRYFAGFNTNEAAKLLELSSTTAHRHWTFAKSWLFREIKRNNSE